MKKILLILGVVLIQSVAFSQDFNQITKAFSNGNVSELVTLLDSEIEFTLDGKTSKQGRAEVESAMRSFFLNHPPKSMKVMHKGVSKKEIHYAIGQLITTDGEYRVTVYMHKIGESFLIESLEIEK